MAGGKREAGRELADLCATYGNVLGRQLTYLEQVQLWLNLDRIQLQKAAAVALGIETSFSTRRLSTAWADALARTEGEVSHLHGRMQSQRAEAKVKSELGWTDG